MSFVDHIIQSKLDEAREAIFARLDELVAQKLEEAKPFVVDAIFEEVEWEDLEEGTRMDSPLVPVPPIILVIKRKAVRLYPDGTRIALYYSDKMKRYFSVPFGTPEADISGVQAESFIDELRAMSNLTEETTLELQDGSQVELDVLMVNRIVYAYDSLKEENQEKFIDLLTSSEESFDKAYEFCRSHYSI